MKPRYATEAEFYADFARLMAGRTGGDLHKTASTQTSPMIRKQITRDQLHVTKSVPIRVKR